MTFHLRIGGLPACVSPLAFDLRLGAIPCSHSTEDGAKAAAKAMAALWPDEAYEIISAGCGEPDQQDEYTVGFSVGAETIFTALIIADRAGLANSIRAQLVQEGILPDKEKEDAAAAIRDVEYSRQAAALKATVS